MKWERLSVEQITAILQQAALGAPVLELCRTYGVSEQRHHRWKKVHGVMPPSAARELKSRRVRAAA